MSSDSPILSLPLGVLLMINRIALLVVCAASSFGGVVHAQTGQGGRLTDAQVGKIDASYRAEIRAIGDSAIAAGLSADPIIMKALQGKQFQASRDKII